MDPQERAWYDNHRD
jgi:DnaJ homolog subfamily A member 5